MGRRAFYAEGTLAERPPPRRQGLMYYATDESVTYIDDGSTWAPMQAEVDPVERHIVWDQFVPGTLSARNPISVIANPVQAQVVLRYLEANLGQAPGAVDASNNLVLDVFGSVSGLAELPLDVNGQSRFLLQYEDTLLDNDPELRWVADPGPRLVSGDPEAGEQTVWEWDYEQFGAGTFYWKAYNCQSTNAPYNEPVSTAAPVSVNPNAKGATALADQWVPFTMSMTCPASHPWPREMRRQSDNNNSGPYIIWRAGGAGIPLDGDIQLALSQVGNPGANPGADLNITLRAELPA